MFQTYIRNWYTQYGRHHLPWRQTTDPYHILISELMLQQTQVERVIPKYLAFLQTFPTITKLAQTKQAEVVKLWQGLGYNRRAKYLHQTAQQLVDQKFPDSPEELQKLPGIGPYTATAICAFSYNQPVIMLETNIRAVYLYHFFSGETSVKDSDLIPYIIKTLDKNNPRTWYWALMDYGSNLKILTGNQTRRSATYVRPSKFIGSLRQVRGAIIRALAQHSTLSKIALEEEVKVNPEFFRQALEQLLLEGMIVKQKNTFHLA
ncbi:MAG: hypothetical protein A2632_02890 [Candidatus Pacebacteria bacterium RIFCSPHIGHO2_01_FULL_46_16]|nr:MAG: hypothetical protein A2632_02890 [Candidatus Pacebacteria bacterium RIFCSPHIGHO2_01_FULL_46_16]OGJ21172.1 MAG: hypothetical protein A3J60_01325 [Candidatus Pacebacteria bacterium RIFCSPHIGHO2_02_FULL_46_9]OGJ38942.1 MAG: hypothetical protein A3A82_02205 [Candidatus Pacebacteria bacterium RIFCSPLOWO2_01_FULL_47_12]